MNVHKQPARYPWQNNPNFFKKQKTRKVGHISITNNTQTNFKQKDTTNIICNNDNNYSQKLKQNQAKQSTNKFCNYVLQEFIKCGTIFDISCDCDDYMPSKCNHEEGSEEICDIIKHGTNDPQTVGFALLGVLVWKHQKYFCKVHNNEFLIESYASDIKVIEFNGFKVTESGAKYIYSLFNVTASFSQVYQILWLNIFYRLTEIQNVTNINDLQKLKFQQLMQLDVQTISQAISKFTPSISTLTNFIQSYFWTVVHPNIVEKFDGNILSSIQKLDSNDYKIHINFDGTFKKVKSLTAYDEEQETIKKLKGVLITCTNKDGLPLLPPQLSPTENQMCLNNSLKHIVEIIQHFYDSNDNNNTKTTATITTNNTITNNDTRTKQLVLETCIDDVKRHKFYPERAQTSLQLFDGWNIIVELLEDAWHWIHRTRDILKSHADKNALKKDLTEIMKGIEHGKLDFIEEMIPQIQPIYHQTESKLLKKYEAKLSNFESELFTFTQTHCIRMDKSFKYKQSEIVFKFSPDFQCFFKEGYEQIGYFMSHFMAKNLLFKKNKEAQRFIHLCLTLPYSKMSQRTHMEVPMLCLPLGICRSLFTLEMLVSFPKQISFFAPCHLQATILSTFLHYTVPISPYAKKSMISSDKGLRRMINSMDDNVINGLYKNKQNVTNTPGSSTTNEPMHRHLNISQSGSQETERTILMKTAQKALSWNDARQAKLNDISQRMHFKAAAIHEFNHKNNDTNIIKLKPAPKSRTYQEMKMEGFKKKGFISTQIRKKMEQKVSQYINDFKTKSYDDLSNFLKRETSLSTNQINDILKQTFGIVDKFQTKFVHQIQHSP